MAKALAIQEPYASLIRQGIKHYETRSWMTNYRGRLYIYASKKPFSGWKSLPVAKHFNGCLFNGQVIAFCDLVDCIPCDDLKVNDTERDIGFYASGRYAWKLENIVPIEPFTAKGRLGIFDIDTQNN